MRYFGAFVILVIGFLSFYYWKLKNSFSFDVIAINDLQVNLPNIAVSMDFEIKNKMLPNFTADYVYVDVWINGQYLGYLQSNDKISAKNGKIILPGTFTTNDPGLTTALMIEPEKEIEIQGSARIIQPFNLNIPINYHGQL